MKKFVLSFSLVLIALLGVSSMASAKSIEFVDTSEYKSLKEYVTITLEEKRNVPTGPNEKEIYKNKMTDKSIAAKIRANEIYRERLRTKNVWKRNSLNRALNKLDKSFVKVYRNIRRNGETRREGIDRKQRVETRAIGNKYTGIISSLTTDLSSLRRKYIKVRKPSQRAAIEDKINSLDSKISRAYNRKNRALEDVNDKYDSLRVRAIKKTGKEMRKASRKLERYSEKKSEFWSEALRKARRAVADRKVAEHILVDNLVIRGDAYIAEMPDPVV